MDKKSTSEAEAKTGAKSSPGFFSECKAELAKVVKPTAEETRQATFVVMIILIFVALVLCLFDIILSNIMQTLVG